MASNSISLPIPIPMLKCLTQEAYVFLLEILTPEEPCLTPPVSYCPSRQEQFLRIPRDFDSFHFSTNRQASQGHNILQGWAELSQAAKNVCVSILHREIKNSKSSCLLSIEIDFPNSQLFLIPVLVIFFETSEVDSNRDTQSANKELL